MSPEPDDVDDAIGAAAANADGAGPRHAAQQRARLLDLAAGDDSDRWDHAATDAGFHIRTEHASIAIGNELLDGVDATVGADWHRRGPQLIVEHTDGDRTASVGLSLSAEAAEGLALDLLELAQEHREAREPED